MLKRTLMIFIMLLTIALPLGCIAEETAAPAATPAPTFTPVPTATPKWFTPIESRLFFARADYDQTADEEEMMKTHLFWMEYITTHMAELCVTKKEVCSIEYELEYSAAQHLEFEVCERITAPDGSVTENTYTDEPYVAGTDEHSDTEGKLMNQVFANMLEKDGAVLPGVYLYEMSVDGELMATTNLTVLESDFSPGKTDHDTTLYTDDACTKEIATVWEYSNVKILDLVESTGAYKGYLFKVENDDKIGYLKCYDVYPIGTEEILGSIVVGRMGGVDISYIYSSIEAENAHGSGDIAFMTKGQAQYCVDQEAFEIVTSVGLDVSRPFICAESGVTEAKVVLPNGKKKNVQLEIVRDLSAHESFDLLREEMGDRLSDGEYKVAFYADGEQYAEYTASCWDDNANLRDGSSKAWKFDFYMRVIAPDGSAYESAVEQPVADYMGEDEAAYMRHETTILEDVLAEMEKTLGVQCGIYKVEVYLNNHLIYTSEIDVLDDLMVVGMTMQQTSLYADAKCSKEAEQIPGGAMVEFIDGKTGSFHGKSRHGDWEEKHVCAPARYMGAEGYVDMAYVNILTDETLPLRLEKLGTVQERKDFLSMVISPACRGDMFAMGTATEEVMTRGMAELAAENQAYRMYGILYYSLKEDRKAQFYSRVTMPDGTVYEETNEIMPSYNLEDVSLYWDFTPCHALKQLKDGAGIQVGSYHYEVTEIGSGMTLDGWFEVLDLQLAMGMTKEDAKIYNSVNGSRVLGMAPIYSPIFLYDGWHKTNDGHTTEHNESYTQYNARVSYDGMMGYMKQRDYHVESANEEELERLMNDEVVEIDSIEIIYSGLDTQNKDVEFVVNAPLTEGEAMMIAHELGNAGIHVKMTYESPQMEQLMLFTFMLQAPSGRQMATSDMYVYFDTPGRDGGENVLLDGATIAALLSRMMEQNNMIENGIYRYSVLMNGQTVAQTEFEIGDRSSYGANYGMSDESQHVEIPKELQGSVTSEYGTVKIREGSSVNVRKMSNADSARVGIVKGGSEYSCVGIADNGWYQIELEDGTIGYVSNKMATLVGE